MSVADWLSSPPPDWFMARGCDALDPDSGERYTVKRYLSEKVEVGDSWRHVRITLKPINPDFQPMEITGAEGGELQVVAEFLEVLGRAL